MRGARILPLACLVALLGLSCQAGTVVLKRAWMNKYKNRATISAAVYIDHAKSRPNPVSHGSADGDLHMASRSEDIGLPFVSEIVNAAEQADAEDTAHNLEGTQKTVAITGAWRLWFEHPSKDPQVQGQPVPAAENTNPLHVFEIHPISSIGGKDVSSSFHLIRSAAAKGKTPAEYEAYEPETAFSHYEGLKLTVQPSATAVTLSAPMVGYNYAEFFVTLGRRVQVDDGTLVLAQVQDAEGNAVAASPIRLVFVKGTPPEKELEQTADHGSMHLLGIPRVNLERVMNVVSKLQNGQQVTVKLPYEMIVVGTYGE